MSVTNGIESTGMGLVINSGGIKSSMTPIRITQSNTE